MQSQILLLLLEMNQSESLIKVLSSLSAFNNNFQINNDIAAEFLCAAEIPTLPLPDHHAVTAVMQAVTAVTFPGDGDSPGQSDQEGGLREQRGVHNTGGQGQGECQDRGIWSRSHWGTRAHCGCDGNNIEGKKINSSKFFKRRQIF